MKKAVSSFIVLALAALTLSSCGSRSSRGWASGDGRENEDVVTEELKNSLQLLLEDSRELRNTSFITRNENGSFSLSAEEKRKKPDYLLAPGSFDDFITLSQKYRAIAMLGVDRTVASLYDMPVDEYDATVSRLIAELNDPAFRKFSRVDVNDGEAVKKAVNDFVKASYEECRANLVWEAVAAGLVEQLYVLTRDIDKFLLMFDDRSVVDLTFDFVCVYENIMSLLDLYPELYSLYVVIRPLYSINAISVEQLRSQLLELKEGIETARAGLLQ